jgi:hypothetical protein
VAACHIGRHIKAYTKHDHKGDPMNFPQV